MARAFVHVELLKVLNIVVFGNILWRLKSSYILDCKRLQIGRTVAASIVFGIWSFRLQVFKQKMLVEGDIARSNASAKGFDGDCGTKRKTFQSIKWKSGMYCSKRPGFNFRHQFVTCILFLALRAVMLFKEAFLLYSIMSAFLIRGKFASNYERVDFRLVMHYYFSAIFVNFALGGDVDMNGLSEVAVLHQFIVDQVNKIISQQQRVKVCLIFKIIKFSLSTSSYTQ